MAEIERETLPPISRLNACRSPGELRGIVSDLYRELGEVLNVTAICGHERGNMMCVIDFIPGANNMGRLADLVGGQVFGFSSVIVKLSPHSGFVCPNGFPPESRACSCTPRS
ncbi:MAG: hypothetical protein L6Q60_08375 [Rhodocyclaceae bacterium]|nr:hypothetical protein [Rhodocyclaceae bacterium]